MSAAEPRLRRLVSGVAVCGLLLITGWLLLWARGGQVGWWRILLVVLLVAVGDTVELTARLGGNRVQFSPGESMQILSFVIAPAFAVVPLTTAVLAAGEGIRRTREPLKATYNVAAAVLSTTAAGALLELTGVDGPAPDNWLLLAVGGALLVVVQGVLVSAAVAGSTGQSLWRVFASGNLHRMVLWASNMALMVVVLACWWWDRSLLVAVAVAGVAGWRPLARLLSRQDELGALRKLDVATRGFPGLDEWTVLRSVCQRVCEMLGVPVAEVIVPSTSERSLRVFSYGPQSAARWREGDTRDALDAGVGGLTVRRSGDRSVVVAPLRAADLDVGAIRIVATNRRVPAAERHLLGALAAAAAEAVRNAHMHQALRLQADGLRQAAVSAFEQARHDPLTGLGNRVALAEAGAVALNAAGGECMTLLLIDLDHFKDVNDTLGHAAGDELLCHLADRLRQECRPSDVLARLGGDEFAILITKSDGEDINAWVDRLWARLREPVVVDGLRLTPEASIGVAAAPDHADTIDGLLRCADVALYQAKRGHRSVQLYDSSGDRRSADRLAVIAELQAGMARDELVLHYQPQVNLATGMIVGVEALARWAHPTRGLLPPGTFVPVVEHSALMTTFTETVLDHALRDAALWQAAGHHELTLAVNISARNLLDESLPATVASLLERHGVAAEDLVLEVTETLAMVEMHTVEQVLGEIRALGVQLSVDDFGTGYSSLTFLHRVSVNEVKLDRAFVSKLCEDDGARLIVEAAVGLAHRLGVRAVGEGVEVAEQFEVLRRLGCDMAQGFYLARPMPLAKLLHLLGEQAVNRPQLLRPAPVVPFTRAAGLAESLEGLA